MAHPQARATSSPSASQTYSSSPRAGPTRPRLDHLVSQRLLCLWQPLFHTGAERALEDVGSDHGLDPSALPRPLIHPHSLPPSLQPRASSPCPKACPQLAPWRAPDSVHASSQTPPWSTPLSPKQHSKAVVYKVGSAVQIQIPLPSSQVALHRLCDLPAPQLPCKVAMKPKLMYFPNIVGEGRHRDTRPAKGHADREGGLLGV